MSVDDDAARRALVKLHQELLDEQRKAAERISGRMSASETLQAATEDLRFSWLTTIANLITELDAARAEDDQVRRSAALAHARDLLVEPDETTAFGARYLRALQDHPAVVFAHRDVVAALG
jgi:gluconate kinase